MRNCLLKTVYLEKILRVLITGSHGFVGRHFTTRLLKQGHDVVGVDRMLPGSGARPVEKWLEHPFGHQGQFQEELIDVRKWFQGHSFDQFDLAIHLAAVVGGRATIEGNPLAVAEDLALDSDFWRWVTEAKPKHVISFSSSAAYPVDLQAESKAGLLLKEEDLGFSGAIGVPDLTYGWAKMTSEYLGTVVAKNYGVKVASYRPFSGYGPDQDSSYPFRAICERASRREVDSNGNFFVWGSGEQARDFVHISDVIDCVLGTYSQIEDGSALNISSGVLTSFKSLAKMACNAAGWDPEIVGMSDKPEGVFSRGGDTSRQLALGFSPRVSLQEGIVECLQQLERGM
jgi:nucleoside-diphosphate-sugar epimerase